MKFDDFSFNTQKDNKIVPEVLTDVFAHKETFTFNKYKYLHTTQL